MKEEASVEMLGRDECVLSAMLDKAAQECPEKELVRFHPGESWTYQQARSLARQTASALWRLGVRKGDRVLVWLPSGPDIMRLHFAISYLGAVFVPINIGKKGNSLEHMLRDAGASLLIAHGGLLDRLSEVDHGSVETLVIIGDEGNAPSGINTVERSPLLDAESEFPVLDYNVEPWDTHAIFYTSGTTGPSKGVVCPNVHTAVLSKNALGFISTEDRFLINLPYFYLGGAFVPFEVIRKRASMALLYQFRTETFWADVNATGSTSCFALGAFSAFMMKQAPSESDRRHTLKFVIQQPIAPDGREFAERFGVDVYTIIDMTEMPAAICAGPLTDEQFALPSGFVGREHGNWPHFDVRLVDENDVTVADGTPGELVVRCEVPWIISPEYYNNPVATTKAWRNGWFHTGDVLRRDSDGNYFFVDRVKDVIRRRGENISSHEVESEVGLFPAVRNCAAIGVKSEYGEQEVMVVVETRPETAFDPAALIEFLVPRMPHFMIPRYIRAVPELAYTMSNKVEKSGYRKDGVTDDTWDREAAGIKLKRTKI
jgi:crotonobetaine/carnitine-CoA ligase